MRRKSGLHGQGGKLAGAESTLNERRCGFFQLKRIGLRLVAKVSKPLGMSDRMALFALKPIKA